jgi:hypothetical protein
MGIRIALGAQRLDVLRMSCPSRCCCRASRVDPIVALRYE